METTLKTLEGPKLENRSTNGHEFIPNIAVTLIKISNLLISFDMKKQLALILTLTAFLITACDDETVGPPRRNLINDTIPATTQPIPVIRISSIYPNAGASGSTVAIFGENFGPSVSHNYVTFDSINAEVLYVGHGMISVRVPIGLTEGNYSINVSAEGHVATAPRMFTVTNDSHQ